MRQIRQSRPRRTDRREGRRALGARTGVFLTGMLLTAVMLGAGASPALGVAHVDDPAPAGTTAQPTWSASTQSFPESGTPIAPSDEILTTLHIRHDGGDPATGLEVIDDISRLAPFVDFDGFVGAWPTHFTWNDDEDGRLVVHLDELAPGQTVSYTYRVLIRADVPPGTVLSQTVRTNCSPTPDGDPCTTTHPVPAYVLWTTVDPESDSTVQPGATIRYRLHAWNRFSRSTVVGATAIDDLSAVLGHATLMEPLPEGLERDGDRLIWHLPELPPASGYSAASFSVLVDPDAWSTELVTLAEPGGGGYCWAPGGPDLMGTPIPSTTAREDDPPCSTVHRTPDVDVRIGKSADPGAGHGGAVRSGASPADTIRYEVTVENAGTDPAALVEVFDELPREVTVVPDSVTVTTTPDPLAAAQWAVDTSTAGRVSVRHPGPFQPGERAAVAFTVMVGVVDQPEPAGPIPDLVNRACVTYTAGRESAGPGSGAPDSTADSDATASAPSDGADLAPRADVVAASARCATAVTPVTSDADEPPVRPQPAAGPSQLARTGVAPAAPGLIGAAVAALGALCVAAAGASRRRSCRPE